MSDSEFENQNKLALHRTIARLTQKELADKSGVNIRQIQRIESGTSEMKNVTLGNAIALADAIGITDLRELLT